MVFPFSSTNVPLNTPKNYLNLAWTTRKFSSVLLLREGSKIAFKLPGTPYFSVFKVQIFFASSSSRVLLTTWSL